MADDNSSGSGGDSGGGDGGGTGYGGNSFANSESGVYSSPSVSASYSNTGAEGSQPLPENWTDSDETRRQANVLEQAPSKMLPNSNVASQAANSRGSTSAAVNRGSSMSMLPTAAYSPGASNPNSDYVPPAESPEQKPQTQRPGQGMPASKSSAPDWRTGRGSPDYTVQRSRYPFQPQTPIAGSGVKKAFFEAQNDLLKTMLPAWNKE